jgi:hypothetical protein
MTLSQAGRQLPYAGGEAGLCRHCLHPIQPCKHPIPCPGGFEHSITLLHHCDDGEAETEAQPARAMPDLTVVNDADARHILACDRYDDATRALDAARQAVTVACAAFTAAEEEWSQVGADMDAAARALSATREAAGVKRTAVGYCLVTP